MQEVKSEFALIDWIRSQRPDQGQGVVHGIGDDMAVLQVGAETLLITTDMLLDGVHFEAETTELDRVGYKAMACSLSDCAAMASNPLAAVVAVALPADMEMEQARKLHQGLARAADLFACPIVGGDTTSWDRPLALNVSMLSQATVDGPVLRSGARTGDAILVTGELGGSLEDGHLDFVPRVKEALLLNDLVELHAMIDLSDGLSADLGHICDESQVAAVIDAVSVPLTTAAREKEDPLAAALFDGEDFELLFCIAPANADQLLASWKDHAKVRLNCIGQIIDPGSDLVEGEHRLFLRNFEGGAVEPLPAKGWEHFRGQRGSGNH